MKNLLIVFYCFLSIILFSQTNQQITIDVDGTNRTFLLYVPDIYQAGNNSPLVFNFHGYTSNSTAQSDYTDFKSIADTAGFILVHPQGLDIGGGFGFNSFQNTDASNYDYRFVEEMLNYLKLNYSIDEKRIYSTGFSNGGFLSYDLACFLSNNFAAIASVSGTMIQTHVTACNSGFKIPVLHIHGTNDLTVSYLGNGGIVNSISVDDLISFWINHNLCSQTPFYEELNDFNVNDFSTVSHYIYENITNNAVVELYKVNNGSHTWPGSPFPIVGLVTNQDFSASKEIWRFFSQHQKIANDNESEKVNFNVFPNPTSNILKITSSIYPIQAELINLEGKTINFFTLNNYYNEFDVKNIINGIYFMKINEKTIKFIKNN